MQLPTFWNWLRQAAVIGAAIVLLFVAAGMALNDKVAGGTLVATLFIAVVLIHILPQLESFKAFGVEAKLRQRLNEADELLRKLRQSTLASAKLTYMTIGWGSRIGGPSQKEKQAISDEVEAVLADLGVDLSVIKGLKNDYLFFAEFDLFRTYEHVVQMNVFSNKARVNERLSQLKHDQTNAEVKELTAKQTELGQWKRENDPVNVLPTVTLREYCLSKIPTSALEEKDAAVLKAFANKVSDVAEECRKEGRVTVEALGLLSYKGEGYRTLYLTLFADEPVN